MLVKLDEWDKKILYELDVDASINLKDLARKIGRSKEFISYRIKRLENEKVINGYTAIVDMSKLGYFTFRIYLKFQNCDEDRVNEMVDYLKEEEQVWTIAQLHGKWDYAFFVGVKKTHNFHKIWKGFLSEFKGNMKENKIAIYSPVHNFNKRFFMPSGSKVIEKVIGTGERENIDELDMKIINTWGVNVRQSSSEIAKKLKTNPKTISSRIKILRKKKIIVGTKIDLDQSKLGYQGYRVDLSLNSVEKNKELFLYCKNHPNIYQINDSIGGADFELEVIVKDMDSLLKMMNEMMKEFKGIIRNYEYFSFFVFPKLTIVPD
ncbi:MAG: Lrp/AsnC family transcriptional regulator [Candidatus Aenigmarchaeota archaeon]|nr:Lrp/AsnC family transcriptional regulator [Candidatus Aenigmarchaeota archaeon]